MIHEVTMAAVLDVQLAWSPVALITFRATSAMFPAKELLEIYAQVAIICIVFFVPHSVSLAMQMLLFIVEISGVFLSSVISFDIHVAIVIFTVAPISLAFFKH